MKKQTLTLLSALIALSLILAACRASAPAVQAPAAAQAAASAPAEAPLSGTISVSGAFALYPMMTVWADEFTKLHPDVQFDVQGGGAGKGMTDTIAGAVDIGMISRSIKEEESAQGIFWYPLRKTRSSPSSARRILSHSKFSQKESRRKSSEKFISPARLRLGAKLSATQPSPMKFTSSPAQTHRARQNNGQSLAAAKRRKI